MKKKMKKKIKRFINKIPPEMPLILYAQLLITFTFTFLGSAGLVELFNNMGML